MFPWAPPSFIVLYYRPTEKDRNCIAAIGLRNSILIAHTRETRADIVCAIYIEFLRPQSCRYTISILLLPSLAFRLRNIYDFATMVILFERAWLSICFSRSRAISFIILCDYVVISIYYFLNKMYCSCNKSIYSKSPLLSVQLYL